MKSKPRSRLQVISSQVNWLTGCGIQPVRGIIPPEIAKDPELQTALTDLNKQVKVTRAAVRRAYERYKKEIPNGN
jgi:hypothetical protein